MELGHPTYVPLTIVAQSLYDLKLGMLEGKEEEKDNEEGKDEDGEKDDEEGETHTGAPRIVHRVGSGCLPNRVTSTLLISP